MVSTMALVDTLDEQALLEQVLDDSKPAVPEDCRNLHYLLFTPFRYGAYYPQGSRFRRAGLTPGVFYAAVETATAVAEMAFWRLIFHAESPATPWPANAGEYTAFAVRYSTGKGLDLTQAPLSADAETVDAPNRLPALPGARRQRALGRRAGAALSVRARRGLERRGIACKAFAHPEPLEQQRWRIHVGANGARAICEYPDQRLAFDRAAFARDPRIASLKWDR